ncbi:MAG: FtsX-like permease family protein [Clostridiales bacterium]|nr:FtsX-like permease family protein [Clostridiales bacterium]
MRIDTRLAILMITRRKKRSLLLILGITIVLMMISAVAVIEQNSLEQGKMQAELDYGDWQLAYFAKDEGAASQVEKTGLADKACIACRLEKIPIEDDACSLDLILVSEEGYSMMAKHIISGRLPKAPREIVVEDWYLRKQKIDSLPTDIRTGGTVYHIVGAFKSTANTISGDTVRGFGTYGQNEELIAESQLRTVPVDNNYLASKAAEDKIKPFVLIRLKDSVSIGKAVRTFEKCDGLEFFNGEDALKLASAKNSTPYYNVYLLAQENVKGAETFQKMGNNQFARKNALTADIMLLIVLFMMAFVSINIIAGSSMRELGLFSAIGLEPESTGRILLFHAFFAAIISLPAGVFLGTEGARLVLGNPLSEINGAVTIPWMKIILDAVLCLIAIIVSSIYPAWKVRHSSPLAVINARPGAGIFEDSTSGPWLDKSSGRFSFAVLFGLKTALKNKGRSILLTASVALLFASFIGLTKEIEVQWKMGNRRMPHIADYTIEMSYIKYPDAIGGASGNPYYDNTVKPADNRFLNDLRALKGVKSIYSQSSILDQYDQSMLQKDPGKGIMYWYYFKIDNSLITPQGKKMFDLACPTERNGYPGISFVKGGIGGYSDNELDFARKYLVEGRIDIGRMKADPVILLPKYIQSVGNINIPYTKLKVGDKITMVEDSGNDLFNISPVKEYVYTIGGFVDPLPFGQISGAGSGFVAIMSEEQLAKLDTRYKGIMEVYVDSEKGGNPLPQISALSKPRGYNITNGRDSFVNKEENNRLRQHQMGLYAIFSVLGLVIFLAIFNLFLSGTLARKPEFALLTAVGMTKGQIYASVISEAFLAGMLGCLTGGILGIFSVLQNGRDLGSELLTKFQTIPWVHIGIGGIVLLFACIIAPAVSLAISLKSTSLLDIAQG